MQLEKNEGGHGDKKFVVILADGKFHQTVDEGTEGAVVRTYTDKNEVEQSKTELVFDTVKGMITKIEFVDGEFGKSMQVEIDGDGIISVGTSSQFGEDFMKKLPALDFSKEVTITPYSFIPKGEENSKKGVSIYQDDVKVKSHFYEVDPEDKKKFIVTNGMPVPEGDTSKFDSDDWKMHFMVVRKFLIKEIEKLSVFSKSEPKDVPLEDVKF